MLINIFILCYNEELLLPHTIKHYKTLIPNCIITIYDNQSTDNSVKIAKELGCRVISWSSQNRINDNLYIFIKNNCWKNVTNGWIIMIDMDEWLQVTYNDLLLATRNRISILKIQGYNMIGESNALDLADIDLHAIKKGLKNDNESKTLCFYRRAIHEMNYESGAHKCRPIGYIKYSSRTFLNKHMEQLGQPFIINKTKNRYKRNKDNLKNGFGTHYINDETKIIQKYINQKSNAIDIL
jgi:hypothetical protein